MRFNVSTKAFLHSIYLSVSLCVFALFINSAFPLKSIALAGLLLSSFWISKIHVKNKNAGLNYVLWQWRKPILITGMISLLVSVAISTFYRTTLSMPLIPSQVNGFVIISIVIGGVEEIVFRGFVQGEASQWNAKGAIFIGALAHAVYKTSMFVLPEHQIDLSLMSLFGLTLVAGLVLGYSRYHSGSLWPCVLAHCFFDFWVYAEQSTAPWWVW